MTNIVQGLLHGILVVTDVESPTGEYLYSDYATGRGAGFFSNNCENGRSEKDTTLNKLTKVPVVGILAGIARVALGIFHTLGHIFAAVKTQKKGHWFHAAKGACEMLRGAIEATPIAGRIFAWSYNQPVLCDPGDMGTRSWWMIKIYNENKPDGLDNWMENWSYFPNEYCVNGY